MKSSFLIRALSSDEVLRLTSIRATLHLVKKRIGSLILLLVYDTSNTLKAAKYVQKKTGSSGFYFGDAFKHGSSWLTKSAHDTVSSIKLAEEWTYRRAISNIINGVLV